MNYKKKGTKNGYKKARTLYYEAEIGVKISFPSQEGVNVRQHLYEVCRRRNNVRKFKSKLIKKYLFIWRTE